MRMRRARGQQGVGQPMDPQLGGCRASISGTSPAAPACPQLVQRHAGASATSSSPALTPGELFLAFGGLLLPLPSFVIDCKPLGLNHISLIALAKAEVVLTQFLHAKVTIKKS